MSVMIPSGSIALAKSDRVTRTQKKLRCITTRIPRVRFWIPHENSAGQGKEKPGMRGETHAPDTSHHLRPHARIAPIGAHTKCKTHFCSRPAGRLKSGPALIKVGADKSVREEDPDVFRPAFSSVFVFVFVPVAVLVSTWRGDGVEQPFIEQRPVNRVDALCNSTPIQDIRGPPREKNRRTCPSRSYTWLSLVPSSWCIIRPRIGIARSRNRLARSASTDSSAPSPRADIARFTERRASPLFELASRRSVEDLHERAFRAGKRLS
jgi:hypothetical protein